MESTNSEFSKIQLLLEETIDLINDAESIEDASATLVNAKVSINFKYQEIFIFVYIILEWSKNPLPNNYLRKINKFSNFSFIKVEIQFFL